ncbi:MAG TPA: DsbA family protein [Solirubrobacteraceae bacterium]|nr:DsbA family protein [Solirubrobacteraceae bacterium]
MAPTLFFDLASPYAYLAVERADRVFDSPPELQPILLGAIFKLRGSGSWAATEHRAAGMAEIERRARLYGLPALAWPTDWPCNSLAADRGALWAGAQGRRAEFTRAVFRREFTRGDDIADLEVLRAAAADAELDPDELVEATQSPEIKQALRKATEQAWSLGVRGVPSVAVGSSVFFGDDRLEEAAAALAAE